MRKGKVLIKIVNTVLDHAVTVAFPNDTVTIIEDHGTSYLVSLDDRTSDLLFWVTPNQIEVYDV